MKSKVNADWVLRLSALFAKIVQRMHFCKVKYFFTLLEKLLNEFKDIKYFIPNDDFLKKVKGRGFVHNDLFRGLIMSRLYACNNPVPIYLEGAKLETVLNTEDSPSHLGNYAMEERYFWALWYAFTVDHQGIPGTEIPPQFEGIWRNARYHFTFHQGDPDEDQFSEIMYVTFEYMNEDNSWHYMAYHMKDVPTTINDHKKNIYTFIKK